MITQQAQHTTGPWDIRVLEHPSRLRQNMVAAVVENHANKIASVWWHPLGEAEANARLIAAAPELLALCEQAVRLFGGHSGSETDPKNNIEIEQGFNLLDRMIAAIAKAQKEQA